MFEMEVLTTAKLNKIKQDTILKNFWKNNDRFADLFNTFLFNGKEILKPDDLTEVDTDVSFFFILSYNLIILLLIRKCIPYHMT